MDRSATSAPALPVWREPASDGMPLPRRHGNDVAGANEHLVIVQPQPDGALQHLDRDRTFRGVLRDIASAFHRDERDAQRALLHQRARSAVRIHRLRLSHGFDLGSEVESEHGSGERTVERAHQATSIAVVKRVTTTRHSAIMGGVAITEASASGAQVVGPFLGGVLVGVLTAAAVGERVGADFGREGAGFVEVRRPVDHSENVGFAVATFGDKPLGRLPAGGQQCRPIGALQFADQRPVVGRRPDPKAVTGGRRW